MLEAACRRRSAQYDAARLNLAGYVNGVARRHAETTQHMFPGYRIHAVTNGVHVGTWTHPAFAKVYTAELSAMAT